MDGAPRDPTAELAPADRLALAGELIGASISVPAGAGRTRALRGAIVDESLGTFVVRREHDGRLLRIPKPGLTGTLALGERELPLKGDLLRVRPEDRTKRLLAGGPRRIR